MDLHIAKRTAPLLIMDIIATYVAYWLASLLTNVFDEVFTSNEIFFILGILAVVNIAIMGAFRLYNNLWEYASVNEALQIVLSVVISTLVGAVFLWVINVRLPIRVFIGASILLVFLMGGYRLLWRIKRRKKRAFSGDNVDRPRTLVVGAGETGSLTINRMATKDPNMPGIPIVATDDDPAKRGLRIHGVKVEGSTDDIEELVRKYDIQQIVVAIPSSTPAERKRIYRVCTKTECVLKTLPNIRDLRIDELGDVALRDVDVTDLLGREEVQLDMRIAYAYVAGETVLVTGGGGSIGSELCRQLAKVAPRRIVIFDICENDAYMLRQELLRSYDDIAIDIEIGSICNEARVNEVFEKYHPAVVFHAAAHKHVPLMEVCPREAIENNVFGTLNVVRAADAFDVEHFTFISTDKAVNPTSVMGATKRMGEIDDAVLRPHIEDRVRGGALRQCARQQRQRDSPVQEADCGRRPRDGDAPRHRALLHDHSRGGAACHPGGRHGEGRRDLRARHGRAGEDRGSGEEPHPPVGRACGHRLHRPARRREDVRGAADGRGEHASHVQPLDR